MMSIGTFFLGDTVDKHGDVGDKQGTVVDKHSGGLSLVKHLVTSRYIVSFLKDNLLTSCKP